jgi:dUTP pyrophosphatase
MSLPKTITVQYLDETVTRLTENKKGDWIDLYAAETVTLQKGEQKLIHLGVAMKLPDGYEAHLVPRSSTYKKWGIIQANHVGIIDNSYSGPNDWWMMSAIAMRDTVINKGDKICQFRIVERQPPLIFEEGKMEGEDRGGFGSTGST